MRKRKPFSWKLERPSRLALWRKEHDLTAVEFAEEAGINRTTLASIERRRLVPSRSVKGAIMAFCGVMDGEFFDEATGLAI